MLLLKYYKIHINFDKELIIRPKKSWSPGSRYLYFSHFVLLHLNGNQPSTLKTNFLLRRNKSSD